MRLLTFLTLFGVAVMTFVSCTTRYKLSTKGNPQKKPIGQVNPVGEVSEGYVDVTFAQQKCLSGKFESVPVKLVGVANESGLPRKDFNSFTRFNKLDGVKGDERGHLVASTFGGPNDDSWNMVPQHISVNRKIANMSNILARWDEFEKYVIKHIEDQYSTNISVHFTIDVNYENDKGCRPVSLEVGAKSNNISDTGFWGKFFNNPGGNFGVVAQTKAQREEMERKKPRL